MLTTKQKTELIEARVNTMLKRIPERAKAINGDGGLPGDLLLPAPQRLDKYMFLIKDPRDIMLLVDGATSERMIRQGLIPPPVSPYLLNLLRVPGLFAEVARDYMSLNKQYEGRYEMASRPEQSPQPAGGGLPIPQAPAPGPPQPQAGGGYGSAGAP